MHCLFPSLLLSLFAGILGSALGVGRTRVALRFG